MRPFFSPRAISGMTMAPCEGSVCQGSEWQRIMHSRTSSVGQHTLTVVQPAFMRPITPSVDRALLITAPQKGDTASDQSSTLTSCTVEVHPG